MGSKFEIMSLQKAGVRLIDCVHKTPAEIGEGNYKYIAIPQMNNCRIEDRDARRISASDFKEWTKKALPQKNDIILSRRCNPGETAFVPEGVSWALGQNLVLLRSDGTNVYPPYLRWMVRSEEWWEQVQKFLNVGAIFDSLKCADIPNFQLPIPSLVTQKQITFALDSLENKIELNNQTNETLESLAKALFKEWFIDFGPVKAKAEGKKPFGMNDETASLFPNSFEDSEIGQIPRGWKISSIYDLASWQNGMAFKPHHFSDKGLPIIKIAELKNGIGSNTKRTEQAHEDKFKIRDGEILFSWSGSPDTSIDIFIWDKGDAWLNQHIFKVTEKESGREFIYSLLKYLKPVFVETARNKQTTGLGHVTIGDLKRLQVVLPAPEVIDAFKKATETLLSRYVLNLKENQSLVKARELLLPKLISGELQLKEIAE